MENFDKKMESYLTGCQEVYNEYHKVNGFREEMKDELSYKKGRRYAKVISLLSGGVQRSVHSFVDMKEGPTFGDVLKPAGWAKPAKHARGNIFNNDNGLAKMGPHGPHYLK